MIDQQAYKCERKKMYPDHVTAMVAADRLRAKTHSSVIFHAYLCRFCHGWHVGRANRSLDAQMRNRARYEHAE